jgi:hypothetical protein
MAVRFSIQMKTIYTSYIAINIKDHNRIVCYENDLGALRFDNKEFAARPTPPKRILGSASALPSDQPRSSRQLFDPQWHFFERVISEQTPQF